MTNCWHMKEKEKKFHLFALDNLLLKFSCFLLVASVRVPRARRTVALSLWKKLKAFCHVPSWISYSDYNFYSQHEEESGTMKIKAIQSTSSRLLYKLSTTDKCTTFHLIKLHQEIYLSEIGRRWCPQQLKLSSTLKFPSNLHLKYWITLYFTNVLKTLQVLIFWFV